MIKYIYIYIFKLIYFKCIYIYTHIYIFSECTCSCVCTYSVHIRHVPITCKVIYIKCVISAWPVISLIHVDAITFCELVSPTLQTFVLSNREHNDWTMRDTVVLLLFFPQGTEVFPLLGSVLHDPEVFKQPEEFNPGRFLDAEGRFKKQEAFLPFSLGKRVCLGEGLARAELFLLVTAILQAFSLESPCPPGALSLQPAVSGLFNIPPAFQLQVRPR
uniref:Uncharacterized protein n=1 Tax=Rhinolophus ferrumequinum TaxID=59479 RepID=A0A671F3C2_RHIFE